MLAFRPPPDYGPGGRAAGHLNRGRVALKVVLTARTVRPSRVASTAVQPRTTVNETRGLATVRLVWKLAVCGLATDVELDVGGVGLVAKVGRGLAAPQLSLVLPDQVGVGGGDLVGQGLGPLSEVGGLDGGEGPGRGGDGLLR
jgi:hypothetical protein